jgi:hypothetical protein
MVVMQPAAVAAAVAAVTVAAAATAVLRLLLLLPTLQLPQKTSILLKKMTLLCRRVNFTIGVQQFIVKSKAQAAAVSRRQGHLVVLLLAALLQVNAAAWTVARVRFVWTVLLHCLSAAARIRCVCSVLTSCVAGRKVFHCVRFAGSRLLALLQAQMQL